MRWLKDFCSILAARVRVAASRPRVRRIVAATDSVWIQYDPSRTEAGFELYFDSSCSEEDIRLFLTHLDDLYRSIGGDGLDFGPIIAEGHPRLA